jgi:hypothetical protein
MREKMILMQDLGVIVKVIKMGMYKIGELEIYREFRSWKNIHKRKIQKAIFSGGSEEELRNEVNDFINDFDPDYFELRGVEVTEQKNNNGIGFIQIEITYEI